MAKIFSGLTILVALAAIFFGFKTKELVEKLQASAKQDHEDLLATRAKLKKTEEKLKATEDELAATKAELKSTQDKLAATEADLAKTKTDLAAAMADAEKAKAELADVKKSFDDLTQALGGKKPAEILAEVNDLLQAKKDLTAKVATLENDVATQKIAIDELTKKQTRSEGKIAEQKTHLDRYIQNIMIKGTRGHVLAVNAGWGFCVVSLGDKKGAAANKVLIVARNGVSIGKVRIINVESSQSVADIIPSSFAKGVYVEPGDEVIYTGEDKVREEPAAGGQAAPANGGAPAPAVPQAAGGLALPVQ